MILTIIVHFEFTFIFFIVLIIIAKKSLVSFTLPGSKNLVTSVWMFEQSYILSASIKFHIDHFVEAKQQCAHIRTLLFVSVKLSNVKLVSWKGMNRTTLQEVGYASRHFACRFHRELFLTIANLSACLICCTINLSCQANITLVHFPFFVSKQNCTHHSR